jgi:hypothetical protein
MRDSIRAASTPLLAALVLLGAPEVPSGRQPSSDGVARLVSRLQQAIDARDQAAFDAIFAPGVSPGPFSPAATGVRRVVRERDRLALPGSSVRRVVLEMFEESGGRARVVTAAITAEPGAGDRWRISAVDDLGALEGLFRLRLDTSAAYTVRDLRIPAPDLMLAVDEGAAFPIVSDEGVTGVVLIGRGEMRFSPSPESERGQLRLFVRREALQTGFESALVRFHPSEYLTLVPPAALQSAGPDPRLTRRATELFEREVTKAFSVDVGAFSPHDWHVLPAAGDLVAEVRTRGLGTLTYSRIAAHAEDVSLVRRNPSLVIALYRSAAKVAAGGRWYSDEAHRDYDVLDYDVEAALAPARSTVRARVRMDVRTLKPLSALTIRLADPLQVTSVSGPGGPLGFVRLRNQHALYVRLSATYEPGEELTLSFTYAGRVESQPIDDEDSEARPTRPAAPVDPHLLLSVSSYWYPQNPFTDYATATLRITVPPGYGCVASGQRIPVPPAAPQTDGAGTFAFRADHPIRYLAVISSRFVRLDAPARLATPESPATVDFAVYTQGPVRARARELTRDAAAIMAYYASVIGDTPYPSLELAVIEAAVPGGHSPAQFVVLKTPFATSDVSWRGDPSAFRGFPEFFLAHEIAHQWWGQAVGGKSYHEQWLSEGFAQYFSALYARHSRGEQAFESMLRQFRRWAISDSHYGPVFLGLRHGQIAGGPRVLRAVVYNKGASVLHMLRRLVGDEVFFAALRDFYRTHRFGSAGTDDLQRAMENRWGGSLERFFDGWIHGDDVPRVAWQETIEGGAVTMRFEQLGDRVFDLPITVTFVHDGGDARDEVIVLADRTTTRRFEPAVRVRRVEVNRDGGAVAEFERR